MACDQCLWHVCGWLMVGLALVVLGLREQLMVWGLVCPWHVTHVLHVFLACHRVVLGVELVM